MWYSWLISGGNLPDFVFSKFGNENKLTNLINH